MPVIYDGTEIRPAPLVTFNQEIQETSDGRRLGTNVTATLTGQITATKTGDVETAIAIEGRLASIIHKQQVLRDLFANDGRVFEVQGYDGSAPVKFNAKVKSISFDQGVWIDVCAYTIVLEGQGFDDEEETPTSNIEAATENWSFDEGDGPHTYRVTHTITARARANYAADGTIITHAWEIAKEFVQNQLKLGMDETATPWSPKSGSTIFGESAVSPDSSGQFNRVVSENIDELDGSYSVTENYFISTNNFWEEYTVSTRKVTSEQFFGNSVAIQGVIHGLYVNLHDIETKLVNAKTRWLALEPMLMSRVSAYATGITLNPHPTQSNVDYNYNEGTISYNYEYNDRVNTGDAIETYNVSMQTSMEDGKTTVTLEGQVRGEQYANETFVVDLKYQRALTRYNTVKLLALARCVTETGIPDLRAFPIAASFNPSKAEGLISYSFSFDNRQPNSVKDASTITTRYSREDGKTFVTVDGTITGYRTANPATPFGANNQLERYNNAVTYFEAIEPNILGLAATYVDTTKVNPTPYSKQVAHNTLDGVVTYNYEYNSTPVPCYPGALSEIITVTDDAATQVIAIIPVLGRAAGPVIQDIGTVKEKRRSLSVEIVVAINGSMTNCELIATQATPNVDITPYAPSGSIVYLEQDTVSWSPTTGRYVRTAAWIYQ
jgi:hypothetical protein